MDSLAGLAAAARKIMATAGPEPVGRVTQEARQAMAAAAVVVVLEALEAAAQPVAD